MKASAQEFGGELPPLALKALQRRVRWLRRLFPFRWCETPYAPPHFEDVIVTQVKIDFGWADRLRLLFSGRALVNTKTATEKRPGEMRSMTVVNVAAPKWLARWAEGPTRWNVGREISSASPRLGATMAEGQLSAKRVSQTELNKTCAFGQQRDG